MNTPPEQDDDAGGTIIRPRSAPSFDGKGKSPNEHSHALILVVGEPRGQIFLFDKQPFVIGRTGPADLLLQDADISRRHCQVHAVAGQAFVRDLNSSNGTYLNGVRLEANMPTALYDGALLEVGGHTLRYEKRGTPRVTDTSGGK